MGILNKIYVVLQYTCNPYAVVFTSPMTEIDNITGVIKVPTVIRVFSAGLTSFNITMSLRRTRLVKLISEGEVGVTKSFVICAETKHAP